MSPTTMFDIEILRRGIEGRDADLLASLYSEDAEVIEIDKDHPPRAPRRLNGRNQIASHLRDICEREMTHEFTQPVHDGDRLAFTETCRYEDGTNVVSNTVAHLDDQSRIMRQTSVTAWDG